MRIIIGLVALAAVASSGACGEVSYSSSAGACQFVDLASSDQTDFEELELGEGCAGLSYLLRHETVCGSQGGVTCVEGEGTRHGYTGAIFATAEAWDRLLPLVGSDCALHAESIDWTSSRVVLAGFDATEATEASASFEVYDHWDETHHVDVSFDWVHEDGCDCAGMVEVGFVLSTGVDPTICVEVVGEDSD
jgi:hypothetical protein